MGRITAAPLEVYEHIALEFATEDAAHRARSFAKIDREYGLDRIETKIELATFKALNAVRRKARLAHADGVRRANREWDEQVFRELTALQMSDAAVRIAEDAS